MLDSSSFADQQRRSDFFNNNLGAHGIRVKLNNLGWSNEEIQAQHVAYMERKEMVIGFMGGQEVYEMLPPDWREAILSLSALRMLAEHAGCDFTPEYPDRPDVVGIYTEEAM